MMVAGKSSCSVQCTTNVPLDSKDFFPESSCERFSQKKLLPIQLFISST